jgi:long-chain acyl-CoA synthetase
MASDSTRVDRRFGAHQNLVSAFRATVRAVPRKSCLLFNRGDEWRSLTYQEFAGRAETIAGGLAAHGIAPGDRVAIVAENSPEWMLADFGGILAGAHVASIYAAFPPAETADLLVHSGARIVFAGTPEVAAKVVSVRDRLPALERIVLLSGEPAEPSGDGGFLVSLARFERDAPPGAGARRADEMERTLHAGSPLGLIYTSGTTGAPKGVVLSHGNILFTFQAVSTMFPEIDRHDLSLAFLPLAHALARVGAHLFPIVSGRTVAVATSLETLALDFAAVRPQFVFTVPRLLEKIHARILQAVQGSSPLRRSLFAAALAAGTEWSRRTEVGERIPPGLALRRALFDRLVFSKVRARLGGRLGLLLCGGAPLSAEVARFFHAAGILVLEGWGATETSAPSTVNTPDAFRFGSVGRPLPGVEVAVADDGELLIRGKNVFREYFHNEAATREALAEDGFYRTGDIGHVDADGFWYVTDRKKEMIITAGGKKIAPQKVEALLRRRPLISNAMLHGDRRPYLVALLTLDAEALAMARPELAGRPGDDAELREAVRREVAAVNGLLARFEQVKEFRIVPRDFSQEAGELTFTLKLKRRVIEDAWKELLEGMYSRGAEEQA